MDLKPGDKFGDRYQLLSKAGEGGMGEVWKARDTKLDRDVALKVSKAEFTARFDREARAIAAFNHPNICQIYDVGPNYIVMEWIDGVPLTGPLPVEKAVAHAGFILDALDAAHRKGFTHRDLKPANVMLPKQGGLKLLDFGLAKQSATGLGPNDETGTALTKQGQISGTLQYMSPEQLNGKEADARSDIFAFGCVLYEMLSGKKAFSGSTTASVIAAIMEREPEPLLTAPPLDRVIRKCLAKDPDERFQTARDLKYNLGLALETTVVAAPGKTRSPWIAVGVLVVALGIALWAPWRAVKEVDRPLVRLDVDLGAEVSLHAPTSSGSSVIISPDGMRLVYLASVSGGQPRLFTRKLDQPKATELPATEGAVAPFFSPDGQWIGFTNGGKASKISVDGGAAVLLNDSVDAPSSNWAEDGIVTGHFGRGLVRYPVGGGTPALLTQLMGGELAHGYPDVLPGGKAVLFVAYRGTGPDAATIEAVSLKDHRQKTLIPGGVSPHYAPDGYLVFVQKGTLFAVAFDPDKLETRGNAVPILDDIGCSASGSGEFDISGAPSGSGTLIYRRGGGASAMTTVQWVDATGRREPLRAKPGVYGYPSLSPDGKRVALTVSEGQNTDIWVYDTQRDAMTRLTFGGGFYSVPIWSPDGRYVVFESVGVGILQVRADGAGRPQALTQNKSTQVPSSFTPDGKRLAYFEGTSNSQIWTVPVEEQGGKLKAEKPEQFLNSSFTDAAPSFSPDGRWLAYALNESGKDEVYVRAFPPPSSGRGGRWQISNDGGKAPRWSRAGNELLYHSGDQIMAASYTVKGDIFSAEKPRVWIAKLGGTDWDLAPDGKRVAVVTPVEGAEAPKQDHEIVMLLNFFDELRRKVPVGK